MKIKRVEFNVIKKIIHGSLNTLFSVSLYGKMFNEASVQSKSASHGTGRVRLWGAMIVLVLNLICREISKSPVQGCVGNSDKVVFINSSTLYLCAYVYMYVYMHLCIYAHILYKGLYLFR